MSLESKSVRINQSENLLLCHLCGDWVLGTGTNQESENYRKILSQLGAEKNVGFILMTPEDGIHPCLFFF